MEVKTIKASITKTVDAGGAGINSGFYDAVVWVLFEIMAIGEKIQSRHILESSCLILSTSKADLENLNLKIDKDW